MAIKKHTLEPWLFLLIPLILYGIWVIAPIVQSLLYSMTAKDSILYNTKYIGMGNFLRLAEDPTFHQALQNNLVWLLSFVILPIPIGLAIAIFFNQDFPGARIFKTLFYIPMTLSYAVIGTIWAWIYQPDFGALNVFLREIGMNNLAVQWLGDKRFMTGALIAVGIWRQVPYVMILYLAGLRNVPNELVEASMIDGASWTQRFRHVVFPMLRPATVVAITISIIDSLRAFDIVYVMTNTKARAAEVLASYMYTSSFQYQDYGYGSAIAVVQFIVTLGFILVYINNSLKTETQF